MTTSHSFLMLLWFQRVMFGLADGAVVMCPLDICEDDL